MNKYLVIGNPIDHSLSPKLHNYWIKKNNINAIYEKKLVEEKDLKKLCDDVRDGKIEGFNVTVPFKEKIIKYLDGYTDTANAVKAVNTVFRKYEDGEYIVMGDNTDVYGFEQSCPLRNYSKWGASALIIGAGGASKAIILGLCNLNVKRLAIINRTREKAEILMNQYSLRDLRSQEARERDLVFFTKTGKPWGKSRSVIWRLHREIRTKANLPEEFRMLHGLRHHFLTMHAVAGTPAPILMS